jgi:hypothetical protein
MDQVELTHTYVDKVLEIFDETYGPFRRGGPIADVVFDVLDDFIEAYKSAVGIDKDPEADFGA